MAAVVVQLLVAVPAAPARKLENMLDENYEKETVKDSKIKEIV